MGNRSIFRWNEQKVDNIKMGYAPIKELMKIILKKNDLKIKSEVAKDHD